MWILFLLACGEEVAMEEFSCMTWEEPSCEWVKETCCDSEECYWVSEDGEIFTEEEYNEQC